MAFRDMFKGIVGKENSSAADGSSTEAATDTEKSGGFLSGSSNFFNSMQAKKEGLMSDLSTKLSAIKLPTDVNFPGFGGDQQQPASGAAGNGTTAGGIRRDSGGDSSASEYGDGGDRPMYATDAPLERRLSADSVDSLPDKEATQCRSDMERLIADLFQARSPISLPQKQAFNSHVTHHTGRSAFAKQLHMATNNLKKLQDSVLTSLAEFSGTVLQQCDGADDFTPAYTLMILAFRLFSEQVAKDGRVVQKHLFTKLTSQPIWQSTRFWNAAFFIAVQQEKVHRPAPTTTPAEEIVAADKEFQDNVTFSQLSAFTWRMYSLGLGKEACMDFLRKQVNNAALPKEKQRVLRMNINKFYG